LKFFERGSGKTFCKKFSPNPFQKTSIYEEDKVSANFKFAQTSSETIV
jgi:hypothetical protein